MVSTAPQNKSISEWLGQEADALLSYEAKVPRSSLHLPGPDWVDRIFAQSDRNPQVLRSLQQLYGSGRLANTGYLSILPVDQGIGAFCRCIFCPQPHLFLIRKTLLSWPLPVAVTQLLTTLGVLGSVSRRYGP